MSTTTLTQISQTQDKARILPFRQVPFRAPKFQVHRILTVRSRGQNVTIDMTHDVSDLQCSAYYNFGEELLVDLVDQPTVDEQSISERCDDGDNNSCVDPAKKGNLEIERGLYC
jgi:hypothetical protein